jgi:hydroxypyruvate reductase
MRMPVRQRLAALYEIAVAAVDPRRLLPACSRLEQDRFVFKRQGRAVSLDRPDREAGGRWRILAIGKAAGSLAEGLMAVPGMDVGKGAGVGVGVGTAMDEGLLVAQELPPPGALSAAWRQLPGDHPWPGERSVAAGQAVLAFASAARPADRHLVLLSGGASALCAAPAPGLTLADKDSALRALMRAGATIAELNTVRKHLSALKGGRLAAALMAAPGATRDATTALPTLLTLAVSDVQGDDPAIIGSGPTVPDPTTFGDALEVLRRHALIERLPPAVRRHLEAGVAGDISETPKPGRQGDRTGAYAVIATLDDALEAIAQAAASVGAPRVLSLGRVLYGAVDAHAAQLAALLRQHRGEAPLLLVAGGEPVVRVSGEGRGGRAQELALRLAMELEGESGITVLVAGTDGRDGPTEAAGAFADGGTLARARKAGCDPRAALERNDSNRALGAAGDLFTTGPTGTNVADVVVAWVDGR